MAVISFIYLDCLVYNKITQTDLDQEVTDLEDSCKEIEVVDYIAKEGVKNVIIAIEDLEANDV